MLNTPQIIPMFMSKISAGFPSPADSHLEKMISLDECLIRHPAATFCLRVVGDSMQGIGIFPGDLLVVDRSITPQSGNIVVALLNGEYTVKRFINKSGKIFLLPENQRYAPIAIKHETDLIIWGVVIHSVRYF